MKLAARRGAGWQRTLRYRRFGAGVRWRLDGWLEGHLVAGSFELCDQPPGQGASARLSMVNKQGTQRGTEVSSTLRAVRWPCGARPLAHLRQARHGLQSGSNCPPALILPCSTRAHSAGAAGMTGRDRTASALRHSSVVQRPHVLAESGGVGDIG